MFNPGGAGRIGQISNTQELLTTPIMAISAIAMEAVTSICRWSLICIVLDHKPSQDKRVETNDALVQSTREYSHRDLPLYLRYT